MHFVYATGQTGQLDFYIAQSRETVPSNARIFATCSEESVAETLSEHTFHAMTDGEFYALQASIRNARELEAERNRLTPGNVLDRLWRRALGR